MCDPKNRSSSNRAGETTVILALQFHHSCLGSLPRAALTRVFAQIGAKKNEVPSASLPKLSEEEESERNGSDADDVE